MADILSQRALKRFGIPYLYPYQRLVVVNILEAAGYYGKARQQEASPYQLVILPTGSGKSLCFMLPADIAGGITLVVYPLLSLIGDQKRRLDELGIPAVVLQGGQTPQERRDLAASLESREGGFVLTNPETLGSPGVLDMLASLPLIHGVIDEAHTVIQWGETFRPSCLLAGSRLRALDIPVITACTATASPSMVPKLRRHLFQDSWMHVIRGNPDRPNITYQLLHTLSRRHDVTRLADPVIGVPRPAVCFCPTRRVAEQTAAMLKDRLKDPDIAHYHAGLASEEKVRLESWFFSHPRALLCATTAYGIGVDKPDIRGVIHITAPPTAEAYLQETGRCGRDGKLSRAVLLDDPFVRSSRSSPLTRLLSDHSRCRRQQLLSLMGCEADSCSGCDVCSRTFIPEADGQQQLIQAVSAHPRRHHIRGWASLLSRSGKGYPGSFALLRYRNLPDMRHWHREDIIQALGRLTTAGIIAKDSRGSWKGLLYIKSQSPLIKDRTDNL